MRLAVIIIAAILVLQCIPESEAGAKKKLNKAVEGFKKLKAKIEALIGHVKNECQKFFKKAKEGIKNSIASIKEEVERTGDSTLKVVFKRIYEGLDKARKKLHDVAEIADKKFYSAMKKAHEMFFTVTSQIESFDTKQRKIIEKKKDKTKALELLDTFIADSSEKVGSCSDGTLNPIKGLYEDTKGIITGSVDKLEAIIRQCEKCIGSGSIGDKIACVKDVATVAGEQIGKLIKEVLMLKDKLLSGVVKQLLNLGCIGQTRATVELDKGNCEKEIKKLQ